MRFSQHRTALREWMLRERARMDSTCRTVPAMSHGGAVLALDRVMPMDLDIADRVLNDAFDPTGARLYCL